MALGGSQKGNGSGNRGRPYGLMLLLAFGAALLGVMMLHKLRERRIFNILIKEKDQELFSIHFLVQKERENSKEMKRNTEEMKAKIYSLRTQKLELDRRLLEMQSTIESMKDEQKIMESALEEKQSENKVLREMKIDADQDHLQMVALTESLKQKEAEIADLKHQPEYPVKIWSVSTDDPSSTSINLTGTSNMVNQVKKEVGESKEHDGLPEPLNDSNNPNSTGGNEGNITHTNIQEKEDIDTARDENASEKGIGTTDRREVTKEEELQEIESSGEGSRNINATGLVNEREYKSGTSQEKGAFHAREEDNASNDTIVSKAGRESKSADADNDEKLKNSKEQKTNQDGQLGLQNVQESEDYQETFRGGVKLEMADNSRRSGLKGTEKYSHASGGGIEGRMVAKNKQLEYRNHEYNEAEKMRSRKFANNNQVGLRDGEEGRTFSDGNDIMKKVVSSSAKSVEHQNNKYSKDMENKLLKHSISHQTSRVQRTSKRHLIAHDSKGMKNGNLNVKVSNLKTNARKQSLDEDQQQENNKELGAEQVEATIKHDRPEELEVANSEGEADAGAGDFYRDLASDLGEDREEYKEETDEFEF